MTITVFYHPLGPSQMAFEGALCASWLAIRIDVQHDRRNFSPIGAFGVCVEKPQVSDQVLFVVRRGPVAEVVGIGLA
jgi:hypothetical protein